MSNTKISPEIDIEVGDRVKVDYTPHLQVKPGRKHVYGVVTGIISEGECIIFEIDPTPHETNNKRYIITNTRVVKSIKEAKQLVGCEPNLKATI